MNIVQNGSFDEFVTTANGPVFGSFWNMAEGKTHPDGTGGRFVRPGPDGVYQTVGGLTELASGTTVHFQTRLPDVNARGIIGLAESPLLRSSLSWGSQIKSPPQHPDHDWTFYEIVPGPQTEERLAWTGNKWEGTAGTGNFLRDGIGGSNEAVVNTELRAKYRLPATISAGPARVLLRSTYWPTAQPGDDIRFEVHLNPQGDTWTSATRIDTYTLTAADTSVDTRAVAVDVQPGDVVGLSATAIDGTGPGKNRFYWNAQVDLEGRKLGYCIRAPLAPCVQPGGGWEIVDLPPFPTGPTFSGSTVDVGQKFLETFGETPNFPVEVHLLSTGTTDLEFDDVECEVDLYTYDSPAAYYEEIRSEIRWFAENVQQAQDRGGAQFGTEESPYQSVKLNVDGPDGSPLAKGGVPWGFDVFLEEQFDPAIWWDWSLIQQHRLIETHQGSGVSYVWYDVVDDVFESGAGKNFGPGGEIRDFIDEYRRTGDLMFLDQALHTARFVRDHGIVGSGYTIPPPPPPPSPQNLYWPPDVDGLMVGHSYRVDDGVPVHDGKVLYDWVTNGNGIAGTTCAVLELCVEAARLNDDLAANRYDAAELNDLFEKALTSLEVVICAGILNLRNDNKQRASYGRARDWRVYHSSMNDALGYRAGETAIPTADAIEGYVVSAPYTFDIDRAHELLRHSTQPLPCDDFDWGSLTPPDDLSYDHAKYLLDFWEESVHRGSFSAGDQARAWPVYVRLSQLQSVPQQDRDAFHAQLVRSARSAFRHQTVQGVWVNTANDWFDSADMISSGNGFGPGPADRYLSGLGYVQRLGLGSEREDLLAMLFTMFDRARDYFGGDYGYYPDIESANTLGAVFTAALTTRALDNMSVVLDELDTGYPLPPIAQISPANLDGSASAPYTFTLSHEVGTSLAELIECRDNRTHVVLWRQVGSPSSLEWEHVEIWPTVPVGVNVSAGVDVANATANVEISPPYPIGLFGNGAFKFTMATANQYSHWDQDTSYQE